LNAAKAGETTKGILPEASSLFKEDLGACLVTLGSDTSEMKRLVGLH